MLERVSVGKLFAGTQIVQLLTCLIPAWYRLRCFTAQVTQEDIVITLAAWDLHLDAFTLVPFRTWWSDDFISLAVNNLVTVGVGPAGARVVELLAQGVATWQRRPGGLPGQFSQPSSVCVLVAGELHLNRSLLSSWPSDFAELGILDFVSIGVSLAGAEIIELLTQAVSSWQRPRSLQANVRQKKGAVILVSVYKTLDRFSVILFLPRVADKLNLLAIHDLIPVGVGPAGALVECLLATKVSIWQRFRHYARSRDWRRDPVAGALLVVL
mmetsp:Transcript_129539/g.322895  ORF Transcript_129539/g.322895 Transcript_129539/m.322895 type:complete len:269 (-) Transcript_129539:128-934(-)